MASLFGKIIVSPYVGSVERGCPWERRHLAGLVGGQRIGAGWKPALPVVKICYKIDIYHRGKEETMNDFQTNPIVFVIIVLVVTCILAMTGSYIIFFKQKEDQIKED